MTRGRDWAARVCAFRGGLPPLRDREL
jgi:hypothetical protein